MGGTTDIVNSRNQQRKTPSWGTNPCPCFVPWERSSPSLLSKVDLLILLKVTVRNFLLLNNSCLTKSVWIVWFFKENPSPSDHPTATVHPRPNFIYPDPSVWISHPMLQIIPFKVGEADQVSQYSLQWTPKRWARSLLAQLQGTAHLVNLVGLYGANSAHTWAWRHIPEHNDQPTRVTRLTKLILH